MYAQPRDCARVFLTEVTVAPLVPTAPSFCFLTQGGIQNSGVRTGKPEISGTTTSAGGSNELFGSEFGSIPKYEAARR
jgi:hypothetical protein